MISFGFYNTKKSRLDIEEYKNSFDVVLCGDPNFTFIDIIFRLITKLELNDFLI